ncbi:helix-turn-helix domain-containing protein [Clostridium thermarum]|uniref:helix-turn-helix domain-containing protein n=1 Tax=Clostridium thermarum TaxID=1716543 RepID=UPI0013D7602E
MAKFKHFTLEERVSIEIMLKASLSFKAIARELDRDCTTISKEVKNHIMFKRTGSYGRPFNNCIHRLTCSNTYLCEKPHNTHLLLRPFSAIPERCCVKQP